MEFGQAVQGDRVERAFRFKNAGRAPLTITRVKASCGCTAALASKSSLAPGEEGEIRLAFDTRDRMGFQSIEVQVFSNDAEEKDLGPEAGGNVTVLRLRGEVTNLLSVMPMSFYFESFQRGKPAERRITVLAVDRPEVKALALETPAPWLRARTEPFKRGAKTGFEVVLEVAPDAPIGKIDGAVSITTDHPRQKTLRVGAFGAIHGAVVAFPERIEMHPGALEGERSPTVHLLRIAEGGALAVDGVEAPPGVVAEVVDVVPGRRAEVTLSLAKDARPGPFAGVLRIFLRDAEQPVFEVPVTGLVPRRVEVDPPAVWLEGRGAEVTLKVRGATLLGALTDVGGPVTATATAEGGPPRALVRASAGAAAGALKGRVVLITDAPGEEHVEVPVRGFVGAR
jgi:hypothetical protein